MRLLRSDAGLEYDRNWEREALDWVYRISIDEQGAVYLTAQEVSWKGEDKRPQMERLLPPIDFEGEIRRKDEEYDEIRLKRLFRRGMNEFRRCRIQMKSNHTADEGLKQIHERGYAEPYNALAQSLRNLLYYAHRRKSEVELRILTKEDFA